MGSTPIGHPKKNKHMSEKIPTPENQDSRKRVIEALRALFVDGKSEHREEALELVEQWTKGEEKKVESKQQTVIDLNLKRAELYFEGGNPEGAIENLKDAAYQAERDNDQELWVKIWDRIDEMEG